MKTERPTKEIKTTQGTETKMPRFTLAELIDTLKEIEADYKVEPENPLTKSWNHAQQSRGWK